MEAKRGVSFNVGERGKHCDGEEPEEEMQDMEEDEESEEDDEPDFEDQVASIEDQEKPTPGGEAMFTPWQRVRAKKSMKARTFLLETMAYFIFIIIFCLTTFALRSSWTFWAADNVRSSVGQVTQVQDTGSFYSYLSGDLIPTLFSTHWYNGDKMTHYETGFTNTHNRRIGTIRMRQVRVKKNVGCYVSDKFRSFVRDCYPPYDSSLISKQTYGPPKNRTMYSYRSASNLCENYSANKRYCNSYSVGKRGDVYVSSGFVIDLPVQQDLALQTVEELKQNRWIDEQTRAVVIDFSSYNSNIKLLIVTQILVEWYPTGSIFSKMSVKPMATLSSETDVEVATLVLEVFLATYLFFYLLNEIGEFYNFCSIPKERCIVCRKQTILETGGLKTYVCVECDYKFDPFAVRRCTQCLREYSETSHLCWKGYFQDPWNWLDMVNLIFFVAVFGVRFTLRFDLDNVNFTTGDRFLLLYPMAVQYTTSNYLNAINALMCFIKTFKYLGKFSKLAVLVRTLSISKSELGYFMIIFGIIFCGFALAFQLGFGSDVEDYQSFPDSMMSLFRMLLGEFNYMALEKSNRVLAPVFFVLYNVIVMFVLSNMFIAIISGAYAEAYGNSDAEDSFVSSSLKLFMNGLVIKFNNCMGKQTPLSDTLELITNLEQIEGLTQSQLDEVRVFRNEVEHDPYDNELFNRVLSAFERRIRRPMFEEDFERLRDAVKQHRLSKEEEVNQQVDVFGAFAVDDKPQKAERRRSSAPSLGGRRLSSIDALRRRDSERSAGSAMTADKNFITQQSYYHTQNAKLKSLEESVTTIAGNMRLLLQGVKFNQSRPGTANTERRLSGASPLAESLQALTHSEVPRRMSGVGAYAKSFRVPSPNVKKPG